LINWDVVPGSTKKLIQEHVVLGKIRFSASVPKYKEKKNKHDNSSIYIEIVSSLKVVILNSL